LRMTRNNPVTRTQPSLRTHKPASVDPSAAGGLAGGGERDGLHQGAHLLDTSLLYVSQGHGHHNRQGETDTGLHLRQSADEVPLEAKAVVDAVVDPLQGVAPVVAALPTGAAVRGWHKDAPIVVIEADAQDASVFARIDPAGLVALRAAFALKPIGGGRAAVLEGAAIGLEALEGKIALLAALRADAVHTAFFGVDDGVRPFGV